VSARLGDYFGRGVQWQRRLWRVGSVLALREISEASDAVTQGALSQQAFEWLVKRTRDCLRSDPGLSDSRERIVVLKALSANLSAGGVAHRQLVLIAGELESNYLERMRSGMAAHDRPGPESFAVALASHLLDSGVSRSRLNSWFKHMREQQDPVPAEEILRAARSLLAAGLDRFEVMLLVEAGAATRAARPPQWRDRTEAARWLEAQGVTRRPRQLGGLLLTIEAWDEEDAVARAHDVSDRLTARAAVGTKDGILFHPHAYLAGRSKPVPLRRRRRADVRALEREDRLFDLSRSSRVDSALELLAQLDIGPSPVAVAGGWSAIESLLTAPGDRGKVVAADRLAALVACSWPRAELTTLGWACVHRRAGGDDAFMQRLRDASENRDKAAAMLHAISNDVDLGLERPAELAAVQRMRDLLDRPAETLAAVRAHATDCLRRLYRQRNLVLHGGQTEAIALEATLRTAAPLVGAGLDRVTHAFLVHGRHPLDTAARAGHRLTSLGGPAPISVLGLFDDP
jgi:hypothetical protein